MSIAVVSCVPINILNSREVDSMQVVSFQCYQMVIKITGQFEEICMINRVNWRFINGMEMIRGY